jgi:hypothetical protein
MGPYDTGIRSMMKQDIYDSRIRMDQQRQIPVGRQIQDMQEYRTVSVFCEQVQFTHATPAIVVESGLDSLRQGLILVPGELFGLCPVQTKQGYHIFRRSLV